MNFNTEEFCQPSSFAQLLEWCQKYPYQAGRWLPSRSELDKALTASQWLAFRDGLPIPEFTVEDLYPPEKSLPASFRHRLIATLAADREFAETFKKVLA